MKLLRTIIVATALTACGASVTGDLSSGEPIQTAPGAGCHAEWPVIAHRAGGDVVADAPMPIACASETGFASSESTIAVTKTGALVYSPAQTENSVARSEDGGVTWHLTSPAFAQPTSFWNTADPYLTADRRGDRLFWAHATGPVRNEGGLPQGAGFYLAAAYGFQVYTSVDDGLTWSTADYQTAPTGDWEQVMVGPPVQGREQPNGYEDLVYLCGNSPVEVSGPGRLCYKSVDGGATFAIAGYVSPTASNPADICPPLNFFNGVIDRAGTIYIPSTCQNADYVVVSDDEGASWRWQPVADAPTGTIVSGGWLQIAIDDADNLYAMWPEQGQLFFAVSQDRAASWSAPMMVAAPGVFDVQRPTIKAGAPGHVGMAYYAAIESGAELLSAYITQTRNALDTQPLFYSGVLNDPATPIFHDYGLTGGEPRLDFIGGAFDSAGTKFWAGMVKQFGPPDADGNIASTGYVGHLDFSGVP
jgi:hypothetical protein